MTGSGPLPWVRLVLLGAVIGVPAALAALVFFTAVHYLEQFPLDGRAGEPTPTKP
jgi:hypothetical protein